MEGGCPNYFTVSISLRLEISIHLQSLDSCFISGFPNPLQPFLTPVRVHAVGVAVEALLRLRFMVVLGHFGDKPFPIR